MPRHHWRGARCIACGLVRVTVRNGRGYPRTHFERDGARFRRTPECDSRLALAGQMNFPEQSDCSTDSGAADGVGIATVAPRQVIPGCKSQPGIE